ERQLDDNKKVKYFMKLPAWFTVDTPVGTYNPDWAIVFDDVQRVYLVRETKSTLDADQRRHDENVKINCAHRHFEAIKVDYAVTTSVESMIEAVTAVAAD
ncbi:MAG: restriction endonuclease, partial [Dermatophilaceae bacterium]